MQRREGQAGRETPAWKLTLRDSELGQIRRECTPVKVYFKKCDYQNVAEFFPGFLRRKICKYSEGIEDSLEEAYLKKKKKIWDFPSGSNSVGLVPGQKTQMSDAALYGD